VISSDPVTKVDSGSGVKNPTPFNSVSLDGVAQLPRAKTTTNIHMFFIFDCLNFKSLNIIDFILLNVYFL
jgi:hypothetical protein